MSDLQLSIREAVPPGQRARRRRRRHATEKKFCPPHASAEVHLTWRKSCSIVSLSNFNLEGECSRLKWDTDAKEQLSPHATVISRVLIQKMQPTSLLQCFDGNGTFNVEQYVRHRAKRNAAAMDEIVNLSLMAADEEQRIVDGRRRRNRSRDLRGQMPKKVDEFGNIVPILPQETVWWNL